MTEDIYFDDFLITDDLFKKMENVHEVLEEQCGKCPFTFSIVLELLARSLNEIEEENDYEDKKIIFRDFIDAIFEFHGQETH